MKMHLECLGDVELECKKNTDKHQGDNDSDYSQVFPNALFCRLDSGDVVGGSRFVVTHTASAEKKVRDYGAVVYFG